MQRARAHGERLDEVNALLLAAFAAWRAGEWHIAEATSRRAVLADSTSTDALHQVGEVLFHYNPLQGRPIVESRAWFEAVLEREPRHYGALWHLAQLAALERRARDVDSLCAQLLALRPDRVRSLEVRLFRAAALRDSVAFNNALAEVQSADESLLFGTAQRLAVYARDLDASARVYQHMLAPTRGNYARLVALPHLFLLDVARGNPDADAHLDALALIDRHAVIEPLVLAVSVGKPLTPKRRALLADALRESSRGVNFGDGLAYLVLGDTPKALHVAALLESDAVANQNEPLPVGKGSALIRAYHAMQLQQPREALQWLDRATVHEWFGIGQVHPLRAQLLQRFLRAEALRMLNQDGEADRWYASIGESAAADLVFRSRINPACCR